MGISSTCRTKAIGGALGAVLLLAATQGCADDAPATGAGGGGGGGNPPAVETSGATYRIPRPLAPAPAGTPIAATDRGPDATFGRARRWTVLHHSADAHGADIAVSATLLVPDGPPPEGGRPVVAWAHGTTGVADACAPSHAANLGDAVYVQEIRAFLRAGYAVAATDYPGLGTPGMHTYLVGADEGNAVVDSVLAARRILPGLSATWFAAGHSQGGQAALFAARAAQRAPGLRFGGAVAVAPASHLDTMLPGVIAAHQPAQLTFALYSLAGLTTTDRSLSLDRLLGPTATRTATRVFGECLKDRHPSLNGVTTEQALPFPPARLAALGRTMAAYGNPDRAAVPSPVLIVQGGNDLDVPAQWTAQVARNLRALGSPAVAERTYPGRGHDDVLGQSICDVLTFFGEHGGRPAGKCTPFAVPPG
ncbi:prolyl oligopeptidase family serine peptidase [Streptomyces sp. AV19]|uniref:alpha/beta hydrolase family protein n=1 Tax=Streptomyces sp. AV19 TaxID=2793068 RepID=UPI002413205F|nr:prolyl oligopeptidase family serine peptidase [Streptomyces sp. AV19]MDG4533772.1 alpha/beta fold hydrolase [Streptomyces sp. AV19]